MEEKVSKSITSIALLLAIISTLALISYCIPLINLNGYLTWLLDIRLFTHIGVLVVSIYNYKVWKY